LKKISLFTLIFILFSCEDNTSNTDEVKEENNPIEFSNPRRATFDDVRYDWSVDGKSVRVIGDNIARDDSLLDYREYNDYGFMTLNVSYNIGQVDSVVMIYEGWKKLSEIDYDIISKNDGTLNVTSNRFGTFSYIWDGLKVKKYEVDNNNYLVSESEYDVTGRLIYEKVYLRGDAGSFYEQNYEYDTNYRNRLLKITRSKVGFLVPQTMQELIWQENTARILYYAEGGNLLSKADITVNEFDDWLSFKWTSTDGTLLQDVKITYKTERFMPYYVPMTTLSKN
tara:strand:+ start:2343 stop:3188 length:846 start_codon:yes stop_codon:yes gene_type:complete